MNEFLKRLPEYAVTLQITHNQHKSYYMTAEAYLTEGVNGEDGGFDADEWISHDDYVAAIAVDSVWEIQWYPDTPVGFCVAYGSTLENALMCANKETSHD